MSESSLSQRSDPCRRDSHQQEWCVSDLYFKISFILGKIDTRRLIMMLEMSSLRREKEFWRILSRFQICKDDMDVTFVERGKSYFLCSNFSSFGGSFPESLISLGLSSTSLLAGLSLFIIMDVKDSLHL